MALFRIIVAGVLITQSILAIVVALSAWFLLLAEFTGLSRWNWGWPPGACFLLYALVQLGSLIWVLKLAQINNAVADWLDRLEARHGGEWEV